MIPKPEGPLIENERQMNRVRIEWHPLAFLVLSAYLLDCDNSKVLEFAVLLLKSLKIDVEKRKDRELVTCRYSFRSKSL